ncbi:D-alanine--D-alanine ligase [compost metagenome]
MDFILNKHNQELYFLEVNTMPGQSERSLIPQQVRAAGMELSDFYEQMLEECLRNKK